MQIELHKNNVYESVELLLLVRMLFLLAIPKCLLIFKENFYYASLHIFTYAMNHSWIRLIRELTNTPFLNLPRRWFGDARGLEAKVTITKQLQWDG